jgi:glycosyltransferase involved in cell wall biosynthesis
MIVNHFLRIFDLWSAERVDKWVVNSLNVAFRVMKFYRKESEVIYPPVEVEKIITVSEGVKKENFFLIVSRLVGAKGLVESAMAASRLGFNLKIVGEAVGFSSVKQALEKYPEVELLGRVGDAEMYDLYAKAKGFIALARNEDFGITPVEAMAAGTPVIAFNGGGFKETVVDGKTGIFVEGTGEKDLENAIRRLNKIGWKREDLISQARKFSRETFVSKMRNLVKESTQK